MNHRAASEALRFIIRGYKRDHIWNKIESLLMSVWLIAEVSPLQAREILARLMIDGREERLFPFHISRSKICLLKQSDLCFTVHEAVGQGEGTL